MTTTIHPDVLGNLTRDMDPIAKRAMELLNQGKDRRWVYWLIWTLWFLVIPSLGLYLYEIRIHDIGGSVLIVLSPVVYWVMLTLYTQVKIWEKQHRAAWEKLLSRYRTSCINLGVNPADCPASQVAQIDKDLAALVDDVMEKRGGDPRAEIQQKIDLAEELFAGDFSQPDLKNAALFSAGANRVAARNVDEERRTRSPFLVA